MEGEVKADTEAEADAEGEAAREGAVINTNSTSAPPEYIL